MAEREIRAPGGSRGPESWLLAEAKGVRSLLLAAFAWAVCAGLMIMLQARLVALACHRIVMERAGFGAILPLAAGVAAVAIGRGVFTLLSERRLVRASGELKQRVRTRLYRRLLESASAGMAGRENGALVEAVTTAVEGLEPYVGRFLPHVALAAVLPPFTLLFIVPVEWRSALILLFSAPFIPLLMVLIGQGSTRLHQRQWRELAHMAGHLLDLIRGLPDLKLFGAVRREAEALALMSDRYRQGTMAVLRVAFLSAFTLEFFATMGTAVVAVTAGFRLLSGSLALVDGLFVLLLAPEFYLPLRTLGLSYHARMQGAAAAERIVPLLEQTVQRGCAGTMPAPVRAPAIQVESLSFRGDEDRGGLTGVTLEIPATGVTALVGPSGSGKSTLARLVVGLARPGSGRILVNGMDLARFDPASWWSSLAWVPQRPWFFRGTVRENLTFGASSVSDAQIRGALEAAAALPFVTRIGGLDAPLGDRGAGLSGGELRRLALARAFLRGAVLLILDEPTAGLDRENERLVGEAIERLARTRTVLLISHREDIISRADRVYCLEAGRLAMAASP